MTPAELAAYSYTAATGKEPWTEHGYGPRPWDEPESEPAWYFGGLEPRSNLPFEVFNRLEGGTRDDYDDFALVYYETKPAALAAADEAYRRAAAEGAI